MKSFEVPILSIHGAATRGVVMALVGLCVLSGLDAPPAHANFTFGEPVSVKGIIPALDGAYDQDITSCTLDGLEMYVQEAPGRPGGQGGHDLWVIKRDSPDADWGPLDNLGPAVNSPAIDAYPAISADGLTLYFYAYAGRGGYGGEDLWMTTRATRNAPWGQPVNMGPKVNTPQGDFHPCVAPDNLELYFVSNRPGGYGGMDIYVCRRATASDPWGDPVNLGPVVNSAYHEATPALSPDGLLLTFGDFPGSVRPGGYGGADLWMARRATVSSPWQTPVNIGPIVNSQGHDLAALISPDGSTLYLWSNRSAGQYVYQAPIIPFVDFNGDAVVDAADVVIMVEHWLTDYPLCDIGPMPWGDGIVDVQDLIVLAEHLFEDYRSPVVERRISASSDDAEEALNPGYNNWNYSSDLEIVDDIDNGGRQLIGLTFRDIYIAPGQVISNAYIEFVCDEVKNGTDAAYFLIWGCLTPNSEGFKAPYVISNRPKTQAKVPWEPDPWNAVGQKIRTVNIASIIQELIDQQGWGAGNAVEIIIGADPARPSFKGVRVAESYDGSPTDAPLLHIEVAAP